MAPLSNQVAITITRDTVGIARAGFGVPLILSGTATWIDGLVREYNSLLDVAADFPVTTSAEYRAARAMFSQQPKPTRIKIAKSGLPATKKFTLTPSAHNTHVYSLRIGGDGVTETVATYTSDGSATAAEIVAGLITSCNAIVGKNFTATGSTTLVLTGNTAGAWFFVEVLDLNDFGIFEDHADPGVATDLAAISLVDDDWYGLVTNYNSNAYVLAAAAYIETVKKIYIAEGSDSAFITGAVSDSDTLDDLKTFSYARTAGAYHPRADEMFAAAWAGKVLPKEPGSETWKFKTLAGVSTVTMTATQRSNLRAKNGNSFENVAGFNMTFEGTTADGDFIDVQRGLDWLEDDMAKSVFGALAGADKIPFTDAGVALLEGQMKASLRRAVARGILSSDPAPTTSVPKVADVSTDNKAARNLPDMKFDGETAGAVHKANIAGTVSV